MRMHSADCAVARCLPSVIARRYKRTIKLLPSPGSHTILVFFPSKRYGNIKTHPITGMSKARIMKKSRFSSNISLYRAIVATERQRNSWAISNGAIPNNLERPINQILTYRHYFTQNISETVREMVTREYY